MLLALKLVLTPTIVLVASAAGRRFGRAASGWFVALPLTSGPITVLLAIAHGRMFGARVATGSLGGAIGEASFCVAYAYVAKRRGWLVSAVSASFAYAATAAVLELVPLRATWSHLLVLAAVAAGSLVVGLKLVPSVPARLEPHLPSRWDLPARAVVSTAFLVALTATATILGPRLSGLIAVYPLYTVVLAAFAHAHEGRAGAVQVLRGLLLGLYSFVAFYFVAGLLLPAATTAEAFVAAFAAALIAQAVSLWAITRQRGTLPVRVHAEDGGEVSGRLFP